MNIILFDRMETDMKILISGGTGGIGQALIPYLSKKGHQITLITRDPNKDTGLSHVVSTVSSWEGLNNLNPDEFDAVINLAGANVAAKRWSGKVKAEIMDSRIKSTQTIVNWLAKSKNDKTLLLNASAVGIYGICSSLQNPMPEDEEITTHAKGDFLQEVAIKWEAVTAQANNAGTPVINLRFGVVLQRHYGMMKELMLPFKLGLGTILGNGKQPISWIHIDDAIHIISYLLENRSITGPVNICSPECVTQEQFAKTFATTLSRPLFIRLPKWAVKIIFGEMGDALLLGGQCAYPKKISESNYTFLYSDLKSALREICK